MPGSAAHGAAVVAGGRARINKAALLNEEQAAEEMQRLLALPPASRRAVHLRELTELGRNLQLPEHQDSDRRHMCAAPARQAHVAHVCGRSASMPATASSTAWGSSASIHPCAQSGARCQ